MYNVLPDTLCRNASQNWNKGQVTWVTRIHFAAKNTAKYVGESEENVKVYEDWIQWMTKQNDKYWDWEPERIPSDMYSNENLSTEKDSPLMTPELRVSGFFRASWSISGGCMSSWKAKSFVTWAPAFVWIQILDWGSRTWLVLEL